jgi:hypothetical protein
MSGVIPYNPGAQDLPYAVWQQEYQQAVQRAERTGYQLAAIRAGRRPVRERTATPRAPKPRVAVVVLLMLVILVAAVPAFLS